MNGILSTNSYTVLHHSQMLMEQLTHGKFLAYMMQKHNPSVDKLAREMGVDVSYVHKLKKLDVFPKVEHLRRAAKFMGEDITQYFPDIPIPKSELLKEDAAIYGTISLTECMRQKNEIEQRYQRVVDEMIDLLDENKKLREIEKRYNQNIRNGKTAA